MFESASKIAKEKGLVVKGSSCHMCGGLRGHLLGVSRCDRD